MCDEAKVRQILQSTPPPPKKKWMQKLCDVESGNGK